MLRAGEGRCDRGRQDGGDGVRLAGADQAILAGFDGQDRRGAQGCEVVPLASETPLRMADWAERNRQKVQELSGGRLGYFHVGAYNQQGIAAFLRGHYGNRDKLGLIVDQRHNGGGTTPDSLMELLARRPLYYYRFRAGDDLGVPVGGRAQAVNVLLIDDVQFIAGKESTQEEFFHTMNELISAGRRLVISADRSPQDLDGIESRILSRLSWGLVADVNPADFELRLNIIVKQTLLAFMNGAMPQVAIEHGRKTISAYERPSIDEVEQETRGAAASGTEARKEAA